MRNDEKCFYRNNSLRRSFKKINNDSSFNHQIPHHCTIELKTKATSCLHLFNKNAPVILTTFKNQQQMDANDHQQKANEILWRYHLSQCDLSKKIRATSQCNLNILRHNYHHHYQQQQPPLLTPLVHDNSASNLTNTSCVNNNANPLIAETKFHNSIENKTTL